MSHLDEVARRKVNGPEGWVVCAWERIGDGNDLVVTGGVPRMLKAGPRKGKPTWRDVPTQKAVVTKAEIEAEKVRYEADTGKCGDCMGKGEVFASCSVAEGTKYRPCKRCGVAMCGLTWELSGAARLAVTAPLERKVRALVP